MTLRSIDCLPPLCIRLLPPLLARRPRRAPRDAAPVAEHLLELPRRNPRLQREQRFEALGLAHFVARTRELRHGGADRGQLLSAEALRAIQADLHYVERGQEAALVELEEVVLRIRHGSSFLAGGAAPCGIVLLRARRIDSGKVTCVALSRRVPLSCTQSPYTGPAGLLLAAREEKWRD